MPRSKPGVARGAEKPPEPRTDVDLHLALIAGPAVFEHQREDWSALEAGDLRVHRSVDDVLEAYRPSLKCHVTETLRDELRSGLESAGVSEPVLAALGALAVEGELTSLRYFTARALRQNEMGWDANVVAQLFQLSRFYEKAAEFFRSRELTDRSIEEIEEVLEATQRLLDQQL